MMITPADWDGVVPWRHCASRRLAVLNYLRLVRLLALSKPHHAVVGTQHYPIPRIAWDGKAVIPVEQTRRCALYWKRRHGMRLSLGSDIFLHARYCKWQSLRFGGATLAGLAWLSLPQTRPPGSVNPPSDTLRPGTTTTATTTTAGEGGKRALIVLYSTYSARRNRAWVAHCNMWGRLGRPLKACLGEEKLARA